MIRINRKWINYFLCALCGQFFQIQVHSAAVIILLLTCYPLYAAPQKDKQIEASIGYDAELQIFRGQTKPITLRAIPSHGYDVEFQIVTQPLYGTLSESTRLSKGAISVFYTHSGKENQTSDSFQFRIKTGPQKAWSTRTAKITINEPPSRFEAQPESLDFGSVFIGESTTQPLVISNTGGRILRGRLELTEPWSLQESPDFQISSGKSKIFRITFAPKNSNLQRSRIAVNIKSNPNPEISIQGIGEYRFEAPDKAIFDQATSPVQFFITNKTPDPLTIIIDAPHPLIGPEKIIVSGGGKSEVELKIKPGFYKEKFAAISLSDGASSQLVKIQLPPPPPYFEWATETQKQLGEITPDRPRHFTARLQNLGTHTATIHIQAQGEGFSTSQKTPLTIQPDSFADVPATWTVRTSGLIEATLTATSEGISKTITFNATVPSPTPMPTPRLPSAPVTGKSNGHEQKPRDIKILPASEKEVLEKRLPSDPSYRLIPKLARADAVVSWAYSGSHRPQFTISLKTMNRPLAVDEEGLTDRFAVPSKLPDKKNIDIWTPLPAKVTKIKKLPDGRWEATVPSLRTGYHDIRITAETDPSDRSHGIQFVLHVPPIPPLWSNLWLMGFLLFVCLLYLLRNSLIHLIRPKKK